MTGVEYLCGPSKRFYLYMFIYTIKRRRRKNSCFGPVVADLEMHERRLDLSHNPIHGRRYTCLCLYNHNIFEIIIRASSIKGTKLHPLWLLKIENLI